MQGHVHLHVRSEGVGSLVKQVPNDGLVLVLACPDQRGPASVILYVDVVLGEIVSTKDDVTALQVSVLGRQVKARHPVVTL